VRGASKHRVSEVESLRPGYGSAQPAPVGAEARFLSEGSLRRVGSLREHKLPHALVAAERRDQLLAEPVQVGHRLVRRSSTATVAGR